MKFLGRSMLVGCGVASQGGWSFSAACNHALGFQPIFKCSTGFSGPRFWGSFASNQPQTTVERHEKFTTAGIFFAEWHEKVWGAK